PARRRPARGGRRPSPGFFLLPAARGATCRIRVRTAPHRRDGARRDAVEPRVEAELRLNVVAVERHLLVALAAVVVLAMAVERHAFAVVVQAGLDVEADLGLDVVTVERHLLAAVVLPGLAGARGQADGSR